MREWRNVRMTRRERAMCDFAEHLTRDPAHQSPADLEPLRDAGLDDSAITDLVQVVSYFNYINRIADGLGVDPETALEEP